MCSSIELLQVMLEETNEKISELAQGISNDLGVYILLQAMLQLEVNIDVSLLSYIDLHVHTSHNLRERL